MFEMFRGLTITTRWALLSKAMSLTGVVYLSISWQLELDLANPNLNIGEVVVEVGKIYGLWFYQGMAIQLEQQTAAFGQPDIIQLMNLNATDNFKLRVLLEESTKSLKFLDLLKVENDISSELAGFEISKLLKDQQTNQEKYAELVRRRTNLVGIMHKQELEEVEAEIASITSTLKESTKKLCKIFKENPDLEKDSMKANRERRSLIAKIEELSGFIHTNTTQKFQTFITQQLQSQDQLRRLMEREKNLNIEIKRLQQQKNKEFKEHQKEVQENQNKIQEQKQKLMHKTQKAEIKIGYSQKEHNAELVNLKRINEYVQKLLQGELQGLKSKLTVETEVHKQLKEYLTQKQEEIKRKSQQWNMKFQTSKETLDKDIGNLTELKETTLGELADYKEKYQQQQKRKLQRETAEKRKAQDKQNKEYQRILLDNAVKLLQNEYQAWKAAGGGKKKKKKVVKAK